MKTKIFSMLLLGGATLGANAAVTVTSTDQLSNSKVYLLQREAGNASAGRGYAFISAGAKTDTMFTASAAKMDTTSRAAQFSFHYSPKEKAYYLYSLGSEKFVTGNSKHFGTTSATAVDCVPLYSELATFWLLDCGGYALASDQEDGFVMFYDDMTKGRVRSLANHFTITEKYQATLTQDEQDAIEAKIADSREKALKDYRSFLEKTTKVTSTKDYPRYLGLYDTAALAYALEHEQDYALSDIEEIYQQTLLSRYPTADRYFRLHNESRPVSGDDGRPTNYLSTATDSTLRVRTLETPAATTAADGYTDDMVLFRLHCVDGDVTQVKIEACALGQFLAGGSNQETLRLGSLDGATIYEIQDYLQTSRAFRIALPSKSTYLSVTSIPECKVWGYGTNETANRWYFEPIDSVSLPLDANGYVATCLPAGFKVPEGAQAFTVTGFNSGKAFVEELPGSVAANIPVIIKGKPGQQEITLELTTSGRSVISEMAGAAQILNSAPGRYVPQFSASGITFTYMPATEEPQTPGSCYIVSDDKGAIETVMGRDPNANISEVKAADNTAHELYDLQGRRATRRIKGLYIDATTRRAVKL